jgi:hypothetical protein
MNPATLELNDHLPPEEQARIFERTLHEDTIFNERLNFFLIFESLLIAAGATLYAAGDRPPSWVFGLLAMLGICVTWVWQYAQRRQLALLRALIGELEKFAKDVVRVRLNAHKETERGVRTGALLAIWIPWILLVIWVAVLLFAVLSSQA